MEDTYIIFHNVDEIIKDLRYKVERTERIIDGWKNVKFNDKGESIQDCIIGAKYAITEGLWKRELAYDLFLPNPNDSNCELDCIHCYEIVNGVVCDFNINRIKEAVTNRIESENMYLKSCKWQIKNAEAIYNKYIKMRKDADEYLDNVTKNPFGDGNMLYNYIKWCVNDKYL